MAILGSVWFMEGVSSQKDMLALVKQARAEEGYRFQIIASHRNERPEILAEADFCYIEPADNHALLPFIAKVCNKHNVVAIHAGKRGQLLETLRTEIEKLGVKLSTGAVSSETFELADNKALFSERMASAGLPALESIVVQTPEEVAEAIAHIERQNQRPCIKPVRGIYGMGFWVLARTAERLSFFNMPDNRQIHPDIALASLRSAAEAGQKLPVQIVMPWLIGPECSVDILAEQGRVIAAVGRRKNGSVQTLENSGPAYQLALACAETLRVDGLINVQTRNNERGEPVLLEANLRPSGGIGYTAFSGVNLPGLFALRQLGFISEADTARKTALFQPIKVIPTNNVKPLPVCTIDKLDDVSTQD